MKHTFTLILIACLSLQMMAQDSFDKQRLDSLVALYYDNENDNTSSYRSKETYKYAENEQLIEHNIYYWNSNAENWREKYEHSYDENGNRTWYAEYRSDTIYKSDEYGYDDNENVLLYIRYFHIYLGDAQKIRSEYTYDTNNNLILEIIHKLEGTSWVKHYKYEYTYDANNNLILEIKYDGSGNVWTIRDKYEYTYDTNNNLVLEIEYDGSGNVWTIRNKYEYTYDVGDNLVLMLKYRWEEGTQTWEKKLKSEYTYDTYENRTLAENYYWSNTTAEFILNSWHVYANTYYIGGILKQVLFSAYYDGILFQSGRTSYNIQGNVTNQYARDHNCSDCHAFEDWYTYDESGEHRIGATCVGGFDSHWEVGHSYLETYVDSNLVEYYEDQYEEFDGYWIRELTDFYEYDTTYTHDELITLFEDKHKRISKITHYGDPGPWTSFSVGTYYYSQDGLLINTENPETAPDIAIYPNPAEDFVIFNIKEIAPSANVELYNARGQLVASHALPISGLLSVRHLSSGVYFYQLYNDEKMHSGKIVVK